MTVRQLIIVRIFMKLVIYIHIIDVSLERFTQENYMIIGHRFFLVYLLSLDNILL